MISMSKVAAIPNSALKRRHLPRPRAPFNEIVAFACSYDAYAIHGRDRSARLANVAVSDYAKTETIPEDLEAIRTCLFFEAQRWILWRQEPTNDAHAYIWALIEGIEDKLPR